MRTLSVLAVLGTVLLVACGGDERKPAATPTPRSTPAPSPKPQSALAAMGVNPDGERGTVTYCAGEFAGGSEGAAVEQFNVEHEAAGLRARFRKLPLGADKQRERLYGRHAPKCDVVLADVTWMGEMAGIELALDVTPYLEARRRDFIGATVDAVRFRDRFWGVPRHADAGFLYYRSDQVDALPRTWQQVYETAGQRDGIVYQGGRYESLTINFLEIAYASGGRVLSEDGRRSEIDSPENLRALELMVGGVKDGAAPSNVTELDEEGAREEFSLGNTTFMRNWPYAWGLMQQRSEVKGKFKAVELPAFEGGGRASVLAGHDLVVVKSSKLRRAALVLVDFLSSEPIVAQAVTEYGASSPLVATYEDPTITAVGTDVMKRALEQARPRPVTPAYPLVSKAIFENVHDALTGRVSAREALQAADRDIDRALARAARHGLEP